MAERKRADSERAKIEEILKRINLSFKVKEYEDLDSEGKTVSFFHFFIAKDEKILEELERALSEKDHETLGRLFGFPESAIKAYAGEERSERKRFDFRKAWQQLSQEEREVLKEEGVLDFVTWIPSENWREELEIARKWQRIIKEKAPRLYEEIRKSGYGKFLVGEKND